MTPALLRMETLLEDVDNLIAYHPGAGRPTNDAQPLLRSCVVLTYAAWEVYVEDIVVWAAQEFARASSFLQLPDAMRQFVATADPSDPWRLAGEGWRTALLDAVTMKVRGDDSDDGNWGLNTASPRQIAKLHDQVLGQRLLDRCSWRNFNNAKVKAEVSSLVRVRGSIVHTGLAPEIIDLPGARSWRKFVRRLGGSLDTVFENWVATKLS